MVHKYPATLQREQRQARQGSQGGRVVAANDNRIGVVTIEKPGKQFRPKINPLQIIAQELVGDILRAREAIRQFEPDLPNDYFVVPGGINRAAWYRVEKCPGGPGTSFIIRETNLCGNRFTLDTIADGWLATKNAQTKVPLAGQWVGEMTFVEPSITGVAAYRDVYNYAVWYRYEYLGTQAFYRPSAFPVELPVVWPLSNPLARPLVAPRPRPFQRPLPGQEPANNPSPNTRPNTRPNRPVRPARPRPIIFPGDYPFVIIPPRPGRPVQPSEVVVTPDPGRPVDRPSPPVVRPARPRVDYDRGGAGNKPKVQKKAEQYSKLTGLLWGGINTGTEAADFVGAMYKSLPSKWQLAHGSKASKGQILEYMLTNLEPWYHIDLAEGVENYVNMQFSDYVAAIGSRGIRNLSQDAHIVTGLDRSVRLGSEALDGYETQGGQFADTAPPIPQLDIDVPRGQVSITGPLGVIRFKWRR